MKFLMLHLTENWALTLIQKNSLPSTAHGSQSSDKQKFHSAPKQRRPVSTEVLSNWPFILWLQRTASSAWWITFLSRELVWNNAPPHIRKPPRIRRLSPTDCHLMYIKIETSTQDRRNFPNTRSGIPNIEEWQLSTKSITDGTRCRNTRITCLLAVDVQLMTFPLPYVAKFVNF
jgi:hypothetical protein